jgi:chaperonin cofactor prefoldin
MTKERQNGIRLQVNAALLYACIAALVGFVIKAESHHSAVDTRLAMLERRTDTLESDLKSIKESLYEIKADVKILIKGSK